MIEMKKSKPDKKKINWICCLTMHPQGRRENRVIKKNNEQANMIDKMISKIKLRRHKVNMSVTVNMISAKNNNKRKLNRHLAVIKNK